MMTFNSTPQLILTDVDTNVITNVKEDVNTNVKNIPKQM